MSTLRDTRNYGCKVPYKSDDEIVSIAHQAIDYCLEYGFVRNNNKNLADPTKLITYFSIKHSPDNNYPYFELLEDDLLDFGPARFCPKDNTDNPSNFFQFRESIWAAAESYSFDALQVITHELGHYFCNHKSKYLNLTDEFQSVDRHTDSECQADLFRDAFLLDSRLLGDERDKEKIMRIYDCSLIEAMKILANLQRVSLKGQVAEW